MIKFLVLSILLGVGVSAFQLPVRSKIIMNIMENIDIHNQKIIYCDDKELLHDLSKRYKTSSDCKSSNLIILSKKGALLQECENKNIFVLNYNLLYKLPQSFGAFFFKKGRANIILLEPRLKELKIKPSKQLEPYIEDQLW